MYYIFRYCYEWHLTLGFTTTYAISDYHYKVVSSNPTVWRGVLNTTLCDKVCQ